VNDGERRPGDAGGIVRRDYCWIWACYISAACSLLCCCVAQTLSSTRAVIPDVLDLSCSQLAALAWFTIAVAIRAAFWIVPCRGAGVESIVEAVLTFSTAAFTYPVTAAKPDIMLEQLAVLSLTISSSWTLMVSKLKFQNMAQRFLDFPAGRIVRIVRFNPVLACTLFGGFDLYLLGIFTRAVSGAPVAVFSDDVMRVLYGVYTVRVAYSLVELTLCVVAVSQIEDILQRKRKTS